MTHPMVPPNTLTNIIPASGSPRFTTVVGIPFLELAKTAACICSIDLSRGSLMFLKVFVSQLFYNRIPKNYCITDLIRWLKTEKTLDKNTKKNSGYVLQPLTR